MIYKCDLIHLSAMYKVHLHGDSKGKYQVSDVDDLSDMNGFVAMNLFIQNLPNPLKPSDWSTDLMQLQFVLAVGKNGKRVDLEFLDKALRSNQNFRDFICKISIKKYHGSVSSLPDIETICKYAIAACPIFPLTGKVKEIHPYTAEQEYLVNRVEAACRKATVYYHSDKIKSDDAAEFKMLMDTKEKMLQLVQSKCQEEIFYRDKNRSKFSNYSLSKQPDYDLQRGISHALFDSMILKAFGDFSFVSDTISPVLAHLPISWNSEQYFECDDFAFCFAECK